jgi:protein phosphatase
MSQPSSRITGSPAVPTPPKPRDEELDFFGLTHTGKVRKENQDHFLVCTLHKTARVRATSLPNPELLEMPSERIASFAMVADGVGGYAGGETASRAALEAVASYVTNTMNCFYTSDAEKSEAFLEALQGAAMESHGAVLARAEASGDKKGMATTLTLAIFAWPRLFLLQVGDSRCYRMGGGVLTQLTRDQTIAQDLVDSGVLPRENMQRSPFAHVLSSSIGGRTNPVVTQVEMYPGETYLLCSDGLTKHVPDEHIAERLSTMASSEQVCRDLVEEALAGGGSDNVTVVVLRAVTATH